MLAQALLYFVSVCGEHCVALGEQCITEAHLKSENGNHFDLQWTEGYIQNYKYKTNRFTEDRDGWRGKKSNHRKQNSIAEQKSSNWFERSFESLWGMIC